MAKKTTNSPLDPSMEDELPVEDENTVDPVEPEVDDDPAEEAEDEPEFEPAPRQPAEEHIPKSRFDAERLRADALERALEAIRGQAPQPQAQPVMQPVVDPDEGLTPEAKNWAKFIRRVTEPEIERRVTERVGRFEAERVAPIQRDNMVVQDMLDDQMIRRKYKDYHLYESTVNDLRQQWFRDSNGTIRAPREYAYAVAKLQRGALTDPTDRTNAARAKAKGGAKVEQKTPGRKIQPKTTVNMDDIAKMSEKELEQALQDFKF